jgi:putative iron-only hydrogenase system regulator
MEKRIGTLILLVEDKSCIETLNNILSQSSQIILARHGIAIRESNKNIISLIVEGTNEEISVLTGKIGRIKGLKSRSVLIKNEENVG